MDRVDGIGGDQGAAVSEAEIRHALQQALAAPAFASAPRMARFLNYVVEETLAGRSDRLTGYTIGVDVFDREADFDPGIDSIVRVEARRLRRTLADTRGDNAAGARVAIELPKGSYVPQFVRLAAAEPAHGTAPDLPIGPRVRIRPFECLSADPDDVFLSRGLTEQVVIALGRFPELTVIADDVSAETAAQFRLEGTFRRMNDRLRVTARLQRLTTGERLWSETFDRRLSGADLFDIEDELAASVAARLADRRSPLRREPALGMKTARADAYAAVLRHQIYLLSHDPAEHARCRAELQRVMALDPEYADGWAALSFAYLDEVRFGLNTEPDALQRARDAATTAVVLGAENASAHHALACVNYHAGDFEDFHVAAERSLQLNPGAPDALADVGACLCLLGAEARGLQLVDRAIALNPSHPGWYRFPRVWVAFLHEDYPAALAELKRGWVDGLVWTHLFAAAMLSALGRGAAAEAEVAVALKLRPDLIGSLGAELAVWHAPSRLTEPLLHRLSAAGLALQEAPH